ncbi:hypothetical protein BDZ89DRAFT_67994 [Hymenopellis radicata]|nr:hypothetical protein BDZ89DRAFT_67994 [Hymenopellis radicata]
MCLRARSHVHMVPTCLLFEICAPPLGFLILRTILSCMFSYLSRYFRMYFSLVCFRANALCAQQACPFRLTSAYRHPRRVFSNNLFISEQDYTRYLLLTTSQTLQSLAIAFKRLKGRKKDELED